MYYNKQLFPYTSVLDANVSAGLQEQWRQTLKVIFTVGNNAKGSAGYYLSQRNKSNEIIKAFIDMRSYGTEVSRSLGSRRKSPCGFVYLPRIATFIDSKT